MNIRLFDWLRRQALRGQDQRGTKIRAVERTFRNCTVELSILARHAPGTHLGDRLLLCWLQEMNRDINLGCAMHRGGGCGLSMLARLILLRDSALGSKMIGRGPRRNCR